MSARLQTLLLLALRGAALFLAVFTVMGLVGELRGRTLDVSAWWVWVGDLPAPVRLGLLASFAVAAGAWAAGPAIGTARRWATVAAFGLLAALAIRDTARFYTVIATEPVRPMLPVPLSLPIALLLVTMTVAALRPAPSSTGRPVRTRALLLAAASAWAIAFPLGQMLFFGTTDYRRSADAAVVFGARVYASGNPSPLLMDRIRTAVDLYQQGLVHTVVMSGGDGADGFNEAVVMARVAIEAGVDPSAVFVDPAGVSTEATVANVAAMLHLGEANGPRAVIAVSQAYHLPRVQLAFATAGIDVLTVPAGDPEPIGEWPILVAREVLAWWAYTLRICLG